MLLIEYSDRRSMLQASVLEKGVIRKGAIYVVALMFSIICVSIGLVGGTSVGTGPNIKIPDSQSNSSVISQTPLPSPLSASGSFCPANSVKTASCQCQQSSFEEVFCKDVKATCEGNGGTSSVAPPGSSDNSYCMYGSSSSVYQQKLSDSTCVIGCIQ